MPDGPLSRTLVSDRYPTTPAPDGGSGGGISSAGQGQPPLLQPPNIIDGPAAAMLTACQARGIPARAVIAYRPHGGALRGADSSALAAFDVVFAAAARAGAKLTPAGDLPARRSAAVSRAVGAATGGMMFL